MHVRNKSLARHNHCSRVPYLLGEKNSKDFKPLPVYNLPSCPKPDAVNANFTIHFHFHGRHSIQMDLDVPRRQAMIFRPGLLIRHGKPAFCLMSQSY